MYVDEISRLNGTIAFVSFILFERNIDFYIYLSLDFVDTTKRLRKVSREKENESV